MYMPKPKDKPFVIPKSMVWEAYRRVAANKGAPGVDGQALEEFEADLRNNLYKIWNRMSSGSYFPPPVRAVEIPKPHGGGVRVLGVPTIADRVAQTVVAMHLEERAEPRFHPDSYGYRPSSRPMTRSRRAGGGAGSTTGSSIWMSRSSSTTCRGTSWSGRSRRSPTARWVLLYVKRWLAAPLQHPDGTLVERDKGTPQGSAVSPILVNLFMHYAFDLWMARNHPGCPFERYADDGVVHCKSRRQAEYVLAGIAARMEEVGLRLHPDKTKIVYCKDSNRRGEHEHTSFTFLGFAFRPREARRKDGVYFTVVPARDQPRGAQGQKRPAPRTADPPAHQPDAERPGGDG